MVRVETFGLDRCCEVPRARTPPNGCFASLALVVLVRALVLGKNARLEGLVAAPEIERPLL